MAVQYFHVSKQCCGCACCISMCPMLWLCCISTCPNNVMAVLYFHVSKQCYGCAYCTSVCPSKAMVVHAVFPRVQTMLWLYVLYFHVSKHCYGCQCLGFLTCAHNDKEAECQTPLKKFTYVISSYGPCAPKKKWHRKEHITIISSI